MVYKEEFKDWFKSV